MIWTIYCHTHVDSGRCYVGLTVRTWQRRWSQHISQADTLSRKGLSHFANAIRKYGKDAFSHRMLQTCDSLETANVAEREWIEKLDSRNPERGFNLTRGGQHTPHPIKNPWDRPEYRDKAEKAAKARWGDLEYRTKSMTAAHLRWDDPIYREKIVLANTGKNLSTETKSKLSIIASGKTHTPETIQKMGSSNSRSLSKESIQKISDSMTERYSKRTGIDCKRHGFVSLEQCHRRRSKAGNPGARLVCKQCAREEKLRRPSRKVLNTKPSFSLSP